MIRNILLSSAALAALATGAFAADLPSRARPVIAPVAFTWTGFYLGVNAGGAFTENRNGNDLDPTGLFTPFAAIVAFPISSNVGNSSNGGFTGGGTVGYNFQFGQFVVGVEGDANYFDTRRGNNNPVVVTFAPGVTETFANNRDNDHFFATARARFGYAYDRSLFYVTGGAAFRTGNHDETVTFNNFFAGPPVVVFANQNGSNGNNVGYVVGGGVEYAFTDNLSAKFEGLYAGFSKQNRLLTNMALEPGFSFTEQQNRNLTIVRVGLNYKFGFGAPVVVAKY